MTYLYRQVRRGRMQATEMNARIFGLRVIAELLIAEQLEGRVAAMEERLQAPAKQGNVVSLRAA